MDLQRRALISLFFFFFLSRTKVCRVKTAAGESDAKDFKVSNLVIGLKNKHGVGVQSWKATPDSCDLTEVSRVGAAATLAGRLIQGLWEKGARYMGCSACGDPSSAGWKVLGRVLSGMATNN